MRARRLSFLVPALAALLLVGGCLKRTKISETYVLDAVAARDVPAPSETPEAVVGVLKVGVPGWIDRPQLSARGATGQIVANEYARWGEPVTKGMQRVMAENLAALLPTRRIVVAPFPPNEIVDHRVDVTLSEGRNRIVRRWAEAMGLKVERLARLSYGPIRLGDLAPGRYRPLTPKEESALYKAIRMEPDEA